MQRIINFYKTSAVLRPIRAIVLAYSYVFTGTKVETPYEWSAI